ncbi:TetR/AcrR family transcriptional regulator [Paenibacillus woosongensis]|uniref:TetR/AcrR family transcriptional regulator n=1 Tax=Paenibacillus woosongensis TaxID=307580 RepID=A0AA95I6B4_9BACL|nr:TetR/AcrR family transcriptional regulator [Paenibacillus woosongensis]WHX48742.1 TetR/AcrR family transcriptional regulator [Paenibacillus woosongensis]
MNKDKKEIILQNALRLFGEKGFALTTVDEIAKESGMTKPSLYKYFDSKETLLLESISNLSKSLDREVTKLYRNLELTPSERLVELMATYLKVVLNHNFQTLMFNMFNMPALKNSGDEKIRKAWTDLEEQFYLWFEDCITDTYGKDIEKHAMDIIFIAGSILLEYFRLIGSDVPDQQCRSLAIYVGQVIHILVKGFNTPEMRNVSLFEFSPLNKKENCKVKNAIWETRRLHEVFEELDSRISNNPILTDTEKANYGEALKKIREESFESSQNNVVLDALVLYLEQVESLREACTELRALMKK